MPSVLLILSDLEYCGDARQATLLAGALPRNRFDVECVSMAGNGPFGGELTRTGIPLHGHVGQRLFDIEDWLALRRLIVDRKPDVIHCWGLAALWSLRCGNVGRWKRMPPVIVSSAHRSIRRRKLGWLTQRVLRHATRLTCRFEFEHDELVRAGIDVARIVTIPPGVAMPRECSKPLELRREIDVPIDAPLVMSVGRVDSMERFRNAVWSADTLRYVMTELKVAVVGDGPARGAIERFAAAIAPEARQFRFVGARPDAAALMQLADVIWVTNRLPGGTNVALEAMAAGKPVVAANHPNLAAVIREGETGFLVPPREPPALARRGRRLLEDRRLAAEFGQAGQLRAERLFGLQAMAERFAGLYDEVAGQG